MRIELNKLDAAGLESGEGVRMMEQLINASPLLPERTSSSYNPGTNSPSSYPAKSFFSDSDFSSNFPFNPAFDSLKLGGRPSLSSVGLSPSHASSSPFDDHEFNSLFPESYSSPDTDYKHSSGYSPPLKLKPGYSPEPSYPGAPAYGPYDPEPSYAPPSSPYLPEPEYAAPVGPVLLEKRPYEVKAVQELPISVAQSYTGFDCRTVPYPDRHYADPEAGCQVSERLV